MAKAIHSMVRVLDEKRSVDFYARALGLDVADRLDFADFPLVYMSDAGKGFELELTINKGRSEPYSLGDGYGHLAFVVDDLAAEHARLKSAGLGPRDIVEFKRDGQLLAKFFFLQDPDGYRIEILQQHGRFR